MGREAQLPLNSPKSQQPIKIMAVRSIQNAKTLARLVSRVGGQQNHTSAAQQQRQEKQNDQEENGQGTWAALGLGLLGAGLAFTAPLLADEGKKKMFGKNLPDRVRQYATADNVFDHFATYQLVNDIGRKTTLMSTRNFYNAMTPGSRISDEMMFGKSAYKQISNYELNSNYVVDMNKLPVKGSDLLNAINDHGLLSYTVFHFLLLLMSTPTRYLDIIFHGFDISADGSVEAKEFIHVLARIANVKTDPDELMERGKTSGLVRYLFNDDLSGSLNKEDFVKLQADLIHDVLEMEFTRYVKDTSEKISETDFCRHLLYSSAISQKKKEKMIKMVSMSSKANQKESRLKASRHSTMFFLAAQILNERCFSWTARSRESLVMSSSRSPTGLLEETSTPMWSRCSTACWTRTATGT